MKSNHKIKQLIGQIRNLWKNCLTFIKTFFSKKDTKNEYFLSEAFNNNPIFRKKHIINSWEFHISKLIYRFFPKHIIEQTTFLSNKIFEVLPAETEKENTLAYINYHSIYCWYLKIRKTAKVTMLCFFLFYFS